MSAHLEGRVVQALGPEYVVKIEADGARFGCTPRKGKRFREGRPVVGDRVRVQPTRDDDRRAAITALLPRRTELARQKPSGRGRKVIVANVDRLVIVASAQEPPLRPGLLDRTLVAAELSGMEPVLCFNKWELADDSDRAILAIYEALDYTSLTCSAEQAWGLDALRAALQGHQSAFVGHSGVGKTSLMRHLFPGVELAVGDLGRERRGRHTTTHARLLELDDETYVVDTPGVREFGLWNIAPGELIEGFIDLHPYVDDCRFAPCSHTHEPGCAVKAAVEAGDIHPMRYASYAGLYGELVEAAARR